MDADTNFPEIEDNKEQLKSHAMDIEINVCLTENCINSTKDQLTICAQCSKIEHLKQLLKKHKYELDELREHCTNLETRQNETSDELEKVAKIKKRRLDSSGEELMDDALRQECEDKTITITN